MSVLTRLVVSIFTLFGTLVFEVVLAMLLFTYLAFNHIDLFGGMVNVAQQLLSWVIVMLRAVFPDLQNEIMGGAVGGLDPRDFLLLILGLLASGVIRMLVWFFRSMFSREH